MSDKETLMKERLKTLRSEFEDGQKMLTEKQEEIEKLQATCLRISGAIQVLEEMLSDSGEESKD